MRVCLFEQDVETLEPLVLTRAAFDLRCGLGTLGEKLRRAARTTEWAAWVRAELREIVAQEHPGLAINDFDCGAALWLNGRWVPPAGWNPPTQSGVGVIEGEIVWAFVAPGKHDLEDVFRLAATLPKQEAGGKLIRYPWELVDRNGDEIGRDVAEAGVLLHHMPASLAVVGPEGRVFVDPTARIDPFVVFDVTHGPVVVEAEAVITAFSRIEGPCVVGRGTQIMGAMIRGGVTLGPQCRIGGEVECSIVQGFSNKYHDGFLGHSYLGEWVNLAAGTQTGDLRSDYGEIDMTIADRRLPTGRTKIGCIIGDHTKSGLGVLINAGSNIGPFCNLLHSERFVPRHMPAFTNWANSQHRPSSPLAELLVTANRVMPRRGRTLTPAHIALYEQLWNDSAAVRERVLAEAEARRRRG